MTNAASSCPSCRAETPGGARFCPSCGARLSSDAPGSTERRIVTTLFADLVGSTALGERHDPEDVDVALRAYYQMARHIVDRFGGVVEKYIGDAVAAVFGVPAGHEDDAERGVRAALAIVDGMKALPGPNGERLLVRVAVNTGRAVVRRDAVPRAGESVLVGDAVNTSARLLEAAPPMSVVVGSMTYQLTARSVLYEELTPVDAKGKSRPVGRWLAYGAVARRGITDDLATPTTMIDREVELGILMGLLDKAVAGQAPQFALVAGEAGIGKSRLLLELFRTLEARRGFFCMWRQGRCPPYGDGLSFWALREIVAAHAGILQTDSPSTVEGKLSRAVGAGADSGWLLDHLRPLVGLPAPQTDREETFAAWQKFFEDLARRRPAIIVIEDVHWANDQTLAFLAHMVRHTDAVPLLLLATARPEFLDAHPRFAEYAEAVACIDVKSLSPEESQRLANSMPGASSVPDIAESVSARSGGNPLFTQELVRYVVERQEPLPAAAVAAAAPATVTTLIAARLDALPSAHRSLLADAAVVGPVFWPGALSAITGRGVRDVQRTLKQLEVREFVRRHGESVLAGDEEFAFWHALTRDVAYEQLPRTARAAKHAAVVQWIESAAGVREADIAEVLAYHCWTAIQLARTLGQTQMADRLRRPAIKALLLAGDRALRLDVSAAEEYYRHAADIATGPDRERAAILLSWTSALHQAGRSTPALEKAEEAVEILRGTDDRRALAVALVRMSRCCGWVGDARAVPLSDEALATAEAAGPSIELLEVLEYRVADQSGLFANEDAISTADGALALCAKLDVPPPPRLVHFRGLARCDIGDIAGLDDVKASIEMARAKGQGREISDFSYNYAEQLLGYEGPRQALTVVEEGLVEAQRRSSSAAIGYLTEAQLLHHWLLGDWSHVDAREAELEALLREQDNLVDMALHCGLLAFRHLAHDGRALPARASALECLQRKAGAAGPNPELDQFCSAVLAALEAAADDMAAVHASVEALREAVAAGACGTVLTFFLPESARQVTAAIARGSCDRAYLPEIAALVDAFSVSRASDRAAAASVRGIEAEAEGDRDAARAHFAEAARGWGKMEIPYETAHALLGQGRCLMELNKSQEAAAPLAEAREIFARLGALPALSEAEALAGRAGVGPA